MNENQLARLTLEGRGLWEMCCDNETLPLIYGMLLITTIADLRAEVEADY